MAELITKEIKYEIVKEFINDVEILWMNDTKDIKGLNMINSFMKHVFSFLRSNAKEIYK